ncbi:MAG TPA: HAD-IA family hydrolase [Thermoanaerobaculia bacterium]|nr:HAD-IA family hydrolase [Thermoanaerobaculia bacterium]
MSVPVPIIRAVTFDVTHTLIHCPRLGEIYAEVLGRHGVRVAPDEAGRLVRLVWQELACVADPARDRFTSHPEGPAGWWKRFLERLCEHLDAPPPSRFAAAELFARFARADSWEVYPDVRDTLTTLRAQGLKLGVVSNWDHRLPELLESLGLARLFDALVYSSEVGVEKPDPRIFESALRRLGIEGAGAALHVGDGRLEDVEGAQAVGMRALHLARGRGAGDLRALAPLPALVAGGGVASRARVLE